MKLNLKLHLKRLGHGFLVTACIVAGLAIPMLLIIYTPIVFIAIVLLFTFYTVGCIQEMD